MVTEWTLYGWDGFGRRHALLFGTGEDGRTRMLAVQAKMLARINARRAEIAAYNKRCKGERHNMPKDLCIRFTVESYTYIPA